MSTSKPAISPTPSEQLHILAVDESAVRLKLLVQSLRLADFQRITTVQNTTDLLAKVIEAKPDVIFIDVESPSRDTLEQLASIRDQQPTAVVMVAQDQQVQTIHAAVASGVCAYSVGGVSAERVRPAIEVAMATFASFKLLRSQLDDARQALNHQKKIDRAKCILMQQHSLSEQDAHQAIRKLAMDRKRKLHDVAEDVIAFSKLFPS